MRAAYIFVISLQWVRSIGYRQHITASTVVQLVYKPLSVGDGDFRPPQATAPSSETPQPIIMKLEIYRPNYFPVMTPDAKISGVYVDVGGLGK